MKQFPRVEFSIAALLAGLFSLVLGCGVGGISGSGSTKPPPDPDPDPVPLLGACEKMCQNLGGCSAAWASADACKAECQDMEGLLRPTVVNAFTQCGQRATCATFTVKVCLREGAATVGVEVTDRMVNGLCAKAQACLGTAFNPPTVTSTGPTSMSRRSSTSRRSTPTRSSCASPAASTTRPAPP